MKNSERVYAIEVGETQTNQSQIMKQQDLALVRKPEPNINVAGLLNI
jgi:hypothetical protein